MNRTLLMLILTAALVAPAATSAVIAHDGLPPGAGPDTQVVEAESTAGTTVAVEGASHGKATIQASPWNPLLATDQVPVGEAFALWLRYQGGPVCAKSRQSDGTQRDLGWAWDSPKALTWVKLGTWRRSDLGQGVVIIRNDQGSSPTVDCLAFVPEAVQSEPLAAPLSAAIAVDWSTTLGELGPGAAGINLYQAANPAVNGAPVYRDAITALGVGHLRLHTWELMKDPRKEQGIGWINQAKRGWDRTAVKRNLLALPLRGARVLLNIPGAPAWLDADHDNLPDQDQIPAYAAWCADLVRIANVELQLGIREWEPQNEWDMPGVLDRVGAGKPSLMPVMIEAFNACAAAMKAVDPTIRVGGAAFARGDRTDLVRAFIRGTAQQLDFVTLHAYASGSALDTDHRIYHRVDDFARHVAEVRAILAEELPGRTIPVHLNEYNISWSWQVQDKRMTDARGAVFHASVLAAVLAAGADTTNAWNECDGIYGAFDAELHPRPTAQLLKQWNALVGPGQRVAVRHDQPDALLTLAMQRGRHRALVLVNRHGAPLTATLDLAGWTPTATWSLDESGDRTTADPVPAVITLPRRSVYILSGSEAP